MRGGEVEAVAQAAFARRLAAEGRAPLAVAVSGGGDSLALLALTAGWAARHGRRVLALTVDHRLQAASGDWTARCAEAARALGADFKSLSWEGDKPAHGLPAAARAARHALLADAARAAGASVILMGHTADDLMEAALMRAEGSTTPDPREWSPSPAWPEGRGVFLLRPLLGVRRQALRAWLGERGLSWIEDPANDDPAYARARARRRLGAAPEAAPASVAAEAAPVAAPQDDVMSGEIVLSRDVSGQVLAAACLCAAGTDRPPRGQKLARLKARLTAGEDFTATLAGARIEARGGSVRLCRDAGETRGGGMGQFALIPSAATVWDGRYELTAAVAGLAVRPLKGLLGQLSRAEKVKLKAIAPAARAGLPAIVYLSGTMICPILAEAPDVRIRPLSGERLRAAIGLVEREFGA